MTIPCTHSVDCGVIGGSCCDLGLYGGRPSHGVCLRVCDQYDGPARGRGDVLHKLIKTVTLGTVTPCKGCNGRVRDMNAKHPSKQTQGILEGVDT